jgi:hypothetical protein
MPLFFIYFFNWDIQLINLNLNRRGPLRFLHRYRSEEW